MHRFKNTTTASKNTRYNKQGNTSANVASGVFCEVCGTKMVLDMYGIYRCSKCEKDVMVDNQVF